MPLMSAVFVERKALILTMSVSAIAGAAIASPMAAARYHCGHGFIYRVSLTECVAMDSSLARQYVHVKHIATRATRSVRATIAANPTKDRRYIAQSTALAPTPKPPLINDGVYRPSPEIDTAQEVLRERLAHPSEHKLSLEELLLSRAAGLTMEK